jgi:hypothetical protein
MESSCPRIAVRRTASLRSAFVAGIHVLSSKQNKDVDGRNKSGHDERVLLSERITDLR